MVFKDRIDAGQQLAKRLAHHASCSNVIVLALPRGGVPIAYEVAKALHAPLDVVLVRKLGVPEQKELAMGAIAKLPGADFASDGTKVLNSDIVRSFRLFGAAIHKITVREQRELERRERFYQSCLTKDSETQYGSTLHFEGATIILVDDGLATGATMRAAIAALRKHHPAHIVVAVPVGSSEACAEFRAEADEVVCVNTPQCFSSVSLWYEDFSQVSDEEVCKLLKQSANNSTTIPA